MRKINDKRFKKIYKQHLAGLMVRIIVDSDTGVNYLITVGLSPSITPLLNKDGQVVIDKINKG
ncbi:MAG: DUF6440 family protein [Lachnospirales bacterium]